MGVQQVEVDVVPQTRPEDPGSGAEDTRARMDESNTSSVRRRNHNELRDAQQHHEA